MKTPWMAFSLVSACALGWMPQTAQATLIPRAQSDAEQRIRVRIREAVPRVEIRGMDLQILETSGPDSLPRGPAAVSENTSQWEFRCKGDQVRALGPGKAMLLRSPVTVVSPAGFVRVEGKPYREEIRIHSNGSNCEVVNSLEIEKYLMGLVNAEFNSKWSEEAIAAQVVAARTYALYQSRQTKAVQSHFDVDATVKDQVYAGYVKEDYRAARVVEKTRGWVLTAMNGGALAPIKAFYHSTCGGHTELPQQVWGSAFPGFKRGVVCPYCRTSPRWSWELDLSGQAISDAFLKGARADGALPGWPKNWAQILRSNRLASIRLGGRDEAQRLGDLVTVWVGADGKPIELKISGPRFREWLGPGRLKSTLFTVSASLGQNGRSFRFRGNGNGHGVGMCQWGAKTMGEKGFKVAQILKYYYPDAILRKFW